MMNRVDFETEYSRRGGRLSARFDAAVEGCFRDLKVVLTEPEPSTGGGVRSRQHVVLAWPAGGGILIGSANAARKEATLCTLGVALAASKARFGAEMAIDHDEYLRYLDAALGAFEAEGLAVSMKAH